VLDVKFALFLTDRKVRHRFVMSTADSVCTRNARVYMKLLVISLLNFIQKTRYM